MMGELMVRVYQQLLANAIKYGTLGSAPDRPRANPTADGDPANQSRGSRASAL